MTGMLDYVADILNSHIASTDGCADFVIYQSEDELVYVDPEAPGLFLITVKEAEAVVPPPDPEKAQSA